jgi:L-lactate dehydrogenase complex protein LldG
MGVRVQGTDASRRDAMTTSRADFLAKIRKGLDDGRSLEERQATVAARLRSPPQHDLPARAKVGPKDQRTLFEGYLTGQSATVVSVATRDDVPEAVAEYLRANNLPARLRVGGDAYLADLPWSKTPALDREGGKAAPSDEASLSHATAGIAETGTLMLCSGADNPVTLNFLPETHIVVVDATDIVGGYEAGLAKVRERYGKNQMPRTVNMISGPSRTGDIGGVLVMGAHGPRRLCVIVVG